MERKRGFSEKEIFESEEWKEALQRRGRMALPRKGAAYAGHTGEKAQGIPIIFCFEVSGCFFFFFFPSASVKLMIFLLWFFCEEQPADCLFISLDTIWFYKIPKLANLHMVHTEQISIKIRKVTSHYLQHKIQSLRMIPEILHGDSHAYCSFSVLAKSSPTSCFLPMLMGLMFPVCAILSHTSVTSRLLSFFQSNDFHSPTYDSHLFFSKISCINEVISTWLSLKTYSKLLHSTWFYHMGFLQFLGSDESVLHWLCGPPWIMSLRLSLIKQLRADFSFSPKTKTKTRERKH